MALVMRRIRCDRNDSTTSRMENESTTLPGWISPRQIFSAVVFLVIVVATRRVRRVESVFEKALQSGSMVSPKLYKNSRTYDFFLKVLGYENGIARFLQRLHVDCEPDCRVLDAGCGTGLLGLYFLDRFPGATTRDRGGRMGC